MALTHDAEHLGSQFALELDGVEVARFTGCSGLGATIQVVEHQTVTPDGRIHVLKRPGRVNYDDIALKRGLSADKGLTDWVQSILDGKVGSPARTARSSSTTTPAPRRTAGTSSTRGRRSGRPRISTPALTTSSSKS